VEQIVAIKLMPLEAKKCGSQLDAARAVNELTAVFLACFYHEEGPSVRRPPTLDPLLQLAAQPLDCCHCHLIITRPPLSQGDADRCSQSIEPRRISADQTEVRRSKGDRRSDGRIFSLLLSRRRAFCSFISLAQSNRGDVWRK